MTMDTWICACIFFFSFWRIWFLSSSSSTLDSKSCRISSSSCFLAASLALISSASAKSSVSACSCSARMFFSSKSCNHNTASRARTCPQHTHKVQSPTFQCSIHQEMESYKYITATGKTSKYVFGCSKNKPDENTFVVSAVSSCSILNSFYFKNSHPSIKIIYEGTEKQQRENIQM